MNSDFSNKKYIIYADGGTNLGFGHLTRVLNLTKILQIKYSSIFLFDNLDQQGFYKRQKVTSIHKNELPKKKYNLLIIDTKIEKSTILIDLRAFAKSTLVIDNLLIKKDLYNFMVLPSFFENDKNVSPVSMIGEKIFIGPKYLILDPAIYDVVTPSKKNLITITFGGSDPNNLTLFILKFLESNISLKDVLVILGPGYKHDQSLLEEIINKNQIINNPKNIHDIFAKSFFVITAFGVTLQELFYLGVSAGIIANYKGDYDDYLKIESYFKDLNQRNPFTFVGTLHDINEKKMLDAINNAKTKVQPSHSNQTCGSGWDTLRNKLLS